MKVNVIDTKANKVEELTLKDKVFKAEPNDSIVSQYLRVYMINQRQGNASTKDRSEVRGGGRKPWRQKGTGRARHGSTRSPIWVGGGVTHGPKPKSWRLNFPKRFRFVAMRSVLSEKMTNKKVVVLDKVDLKKPSTRALLDILNKLKVDDKAIIVWSKEGQNIVKSAKNLTNCRAVFSGELNTYDIVWANTVIFTKDAIKEIEERYDR
jgi:large subunit ribosomal protein L4